MRPGFKKPVFLDDAQKGKLKEEFINGVIPTSTRTAKQETRKFNLRMPDNLYKTIEEISHITGQSMNSICLEFIWESVKEKIKYLKD